MINIKALLKLQETHLFIQHRDGMWYTLYEGILIPNKDTKGSPFPLDTYNDDGTHKSFSTCDIIKVVRDSQVLLDYSVTE